MLADAGNPEAITVAVPLPFLDELPVAKQQELPVMKFAGHTYSAIASGRLIINNGIKRVGNAVGPGLKLEEMASKSCDWIYQRRTCGMGQGTFSAKQKPPPLGWGNICWLCRSRMGMADRPNFTRNKVVSCFCQIRIES
jgi:hypothetical protein